jgi:hypothetical protein
MDFPCKTQGKTPEQVLLVRPQELPPTARVSVNLQCAHGMEWSHPVSINSCHIDVTVLGPCTLGSVRTPGTLGSVRGGGGGGDGPVGLQAVLCREAALHGGGQSCVQACSSDRKYSLSRTISLGM